MKSIASLTTHRPARAAAVAVAVATFALATAAPPAVADDGLNQPFAPSAHAVPSLAMGDNITDRSRSGKRADAATAHARQAIGHSRAGAPRLVSERPPRHPVAVTQGPARPAAAASRLGSGHMFPPRGVPKW